MTHSHSLQRWDTPSPCSPSPIGDLAISYQKSQGGLSGSQHFFLHLMDPKHPRVRNASSFSKESSNGQDQAFFSKLASKAKMLSPSHPRVKIPHV
ncbi:hypothetical protein DEO72_LG3g1483 [Vigna unguiculata]|uniref:Uncharacterized protein n=1 Tax=Vigna unguiculata TaxID=3917 RepID=A0A4D6LEC2_VIGUN|nr:hypothetical protein DEO72_LG3g1483 [Vigna unguiculata]